MAGPIVACSARGPAAQQDPDADASVEALVAFDVVFDVLQHPRCLNCHPTGDRPLQSDASTAHAMNVRRGDDDRGVPGMRCAGCHGKRNHASALLPPGTDSDWRLAPRSMAFEGRSRAELASMLLDERRSHLSPQQLLHHVEHDPLVLWGWSPGPGRTAVPVPHAEFVTAFRTWIDAGAPLPAPED